MTNALMRPMSFERPVVREKELTGERQMTRGTGCDARCTRELDEALLCDRDTSPVGELDGEKPGIGRGRE